MVMLADSVDGVIGVDTHLDTHTAAVCGRAGAVVASGVFTTVPDGLEALVDFGVDAVPGPRAWAVEGCGSYGAGLAALLIARGEQVVEVQRPKRARRRGQDKNDEVDAVRAARDALAATRQVSPKQSVAVKKLQVLLAVRGSAIEARTAAVNLLHALLTTGPAELREHVHGLTGARLVDACWMMPAALGVSQDPVTVATVTALVTTAERIMFLTEEIVRHDTELSALVDAAVPRLLTRVGVGPVSAAQLAVGYGHHGRIANEAAFAHLAGVAPIEASSGKTVRHRLNRGGDRALNQALHTIVITRMRYDPRTRAYVERRRAEGKTDREIRRCLKRYVARSMFRDLKHCRLAA